MSVTVYAENMGFFHKTSGGKSIAPGDVCLSPPPSPTGPVPVPYVNMLQSSDLAKGSKSVKIQGSPTALENTSHISTSSGDEAGNQGGGLVTHKTKGKGYFKAWSFKIRAEGKGVDRHGDPMGQNCGSDPPQTVCPKAFNKFLAMLTKVQKETECDEAYSDACRPSRTAAQRDAVNGEPCWECKTTIWDKSIGSKPEWSRNANGDWVEKEYMTHDHQPPLCVAWEMGGCNMDFDDFMEYFASAESVKPHCRGCARSQGSQAAKFARNFIEEVPTSL